VWLELEGLPIYHRRSIHRFVGFFPVSRARARARWRPEACPMITRPI
jgi:hypothetical protein